MISIPQSNPKFIMSLYLRSLEAYDFIYFVNPEFPRSDIFDGVRKHFKARVLTSACRSISDFIPVSASRDAIGLLIFDANCFDLIEDLLDVLQYIRKYFPNYTLVLLRRSISCIDFGVERITICDISAPSSLTFNSFLSHLSVAQENNKTWQTRSGLIKDY